MKKDFDAIEKFLNQLTHAVKQKDILLKYKPIKVAFRSRLKIILYQNNFRALYLIKGIITELNSDNIPAVIPLVRSMYELMIQLGYLCEQIANSQDYKYLLSEPLMKTFLGNKNKDTGPFALGTVESVNVLTMAKHTDTLLNSINAGSSDTHKLAINLYADLSNLSHPNYMSNMLFSSIDNEGKLITLEDIGADMKTVKSLAYDFYMSPLIIAISLYQLFMDKILNDPKVKEEETAVT